MTDVSNAKNLELAVFHLTGAVNDLLQAVTSLQEGFLEESGRLERLEGGSRRSTAADKLIRSAYAQLESAMDAVAETR